MFILFVFQITAGTGKDVQEAAKGCIGEIEKDDKIPAGYDTFEKEEKK